MGQQKGLSSFLDPWTWSHTCRCWAQAVGVVEGRCLRLGPGWAVLLCHLNPFWGQFPLLSKWGGGGWGCYGPCDSRDFKAWPANISSLTNLATPHGPGRAAAYGGMSGGLGPCCPPGSPSSDPLLPGGALPLGRCSGEALGDNSREEGCSSSEGGAVEGLGTGPHPGLSLLGHPG